MELKEVARLFRLNASEFIVLSYLRDDAHYQYATLEEIQALTSLGRQAVTLALIVLEGKDLVDLRFKRSGAVSAGRAVTDATLQYRRGIAEYDNKKLNKIRL